ncbi:MAG: hypothetical protein ACOXZ1_01710 [Patescibacteria group bacterium]
MSNLNNNRIMKKIVLFVVVFFAPFIVLAQNEAPKVSLSYDGKTTFLDQYVSSEGDTLSKIGMFAANIVSGEYFFGYNDFQVGVLGEFKNSQTLNKLAVRREASIIFKFGSYFSLQLQPWRGEVGRRVLPRLPKEFWHLRSRFF